MRPCVRGGGDGAGADQHGNAAGAGQHGDVAGGTALAEDDAATTGPVHGEELGGGDVAAVDDGAGGGLLVAGAGQGAEDARGDVTKIGASGAKVGVFGCLIAMNFC